MPSNNDTRTLTELKELLWTRGVIPKRWMLNYIKKAEAVYLADNVKEGDGLPDAYLTVIKERCSKHKKKVYRSRKNRQQSFSSDLTKDEKLKLVVNTANSLVFSEVVEVEEGFTSYLGSSRGKIAFIFHDAANSEYKFTRTEVEKLVKLGLYIPRGVLSTSRTKIQKPAASSKRLKDIFGT